MKIKKFIAPDVSKGKADIMKELGSDAVVLSVRTVEKPGADSYVEIVAAADDAPVKKTRQEPKNPLSERKPSIIPKSDGSEAPTRSDFELAEIKRISLEILDRVKYKNSDRLAPNSEKIYKKLVDVGFSDNKAYELVSKASDESKSGSEKDIQTIVKREIAKSVEVFNPLSKNEGPRIAAFVGQTGAGKTTTLAKLAAAAQIALKVDIALVSADSGKLGGAEQLRLFSSTADMPYYYAPTAGEIKKTFLHLTDKDFLFLDTAGFSPLNRNAMKKLEEMLGEVDPAQIFLVVSASSSADAFDLCLKNFEQIKPSGLILTKLDENLKIGKIIERIEKSGIPLAYFTTGREIPDDIEPANSEKLADIIFKDKSFYST